MSKEIAENKKLDSNIKLKKEEKPLVFKCSKCNIEKDFNDINFSKNKKSKFGLKKICKDCESEYASERNLKKRAFKYKILEKDIYNPIAWYNVYMDYNLSQMPTICYTKESRIQIIRYIAFDKINIKNEYELIAKFNRPIFEKYRIATWMVLFGGKLAMFKECFPEFEFNESNIGRKYISDIAIEVAIDKWFNENDHTVLNLFNTSLDKIFSKEMVNISVSRFDGYIGTLLWYFKRKGIKHPQYNREIKECDFMSPGNGYYENKENRIERIKDYCEVECEESILNYIEDTSLLKVWVYKYFKSSDICELFPYSDYYKSLYNALIDAYPQIRKDNILFEWEWTQCNNSNINFLVEMLRDFILYRMDKVIINLIEDIPIYINRIYIAEIEPKLNKQLDRKRFDSYYEWCCLSFPEYSDCWTPRDFDECVAYDGARCDSKQEMMVYEFIKRELNLKYIQAIGNKRSGKYTFELDETYSYERFCPDFIIEHLEMNGEKAKLKKPIILEYYGMYEENNKNEVFQKYKEKTKTKNKYYNSNKNIYFIPIYPQDIKNNFENLVKKLDSFLFENFNCRVA